MTCDQSHRQRPTSWIEHPAARPLILVVAGCTALAVGALVYLGDRDPSRTLLIPVIASLAGQHAFGAIGNWLPSFVHPFAFSLLTAAALPPRRALWYGGCLAWAIINLAFEIGQHPRLGAHLAEWLNGAFGQAPWSQALARYFVHGTFDPGDLAAIVLGSLCAAAVIHYVSSASEGKHAT